LISSILGKKKGNKEERGEDKDEPGKKKSDGPTEFERGVIAASRWLSQQRGHENNAVLSIRMLRETPDVESGQAPTARKTQRERALLQIAELRRLYSQLEQIRAPLREVLDEAQNRRPEGASDGTIDDACWTGASGVSSALDMLLRELVLFARKIGV
jgi:hypothetical protein